MMLRYLRPDLLASRGHRGLRRLGGHVRRDRHPGRGRARRRQASGSTAGSPGSSTCPSCCGLARRRRREDRRRPRPARPGLSRAPTASGAGDRMVEPSDELLDFMRDLGDRAARVRNRAVDPDEDNMLKITNDGRPAALDLRLVGLPQTTRARSTAAADRSPRSGRAHQDDDYLDPDGIPYPVRGALQLVFSDLGTPGTGLERLRRAPRQARRPRRAPRGDPVHARGQDRPGQGRAVRRLPRRAGRRADRLHREDGRRHQRAGPRHRPAPPGLPWRPADVAQREGRILRQGNHNPEVEILRYVTEGSFDAYMWQTVARKAASSARSCTAASTPARSPTSATPPCPTARSRPSPPATRCSSTKPKPTPPWPGSSGRTRPPAQPGRAPPRHWRLRGRDRQAHRVRRRR